ncbi:MAG: hypothetical protein AB7F86_04500 [Bdellovibrionales bacterium]
MSSHWDQTPPGITINSGPQAVSGATTAQFVLSSDKADVTFQCALDAQPFYVCESPVSISGLTLGQHIFRARASDTAGNFSSPIEYSWEVSPGAMTIAFTNPPTGFSKLKNLSVTFGGTDGQQPIVLFECSVDNSAYAACTSPLLLTNLADGLHTTSIRGKSQGGLVSSPLTASWITDASAPNLTVNIPAAFYGAAGATTAPVVIPVAVFDVGPSGLKRVTCKLDNLAETPCQGGLTYTLPTTYEFVATTPHSFTATAEDLAGNITTVTKTFKVYYVDIPPPPDVN